ncbi:uncharacterized protein LOC133867466 [Alnus glutinosa]|uniref:uncharacterized protein LOC133867466 n=1 Tax=Alnus glutinosa TaxID=3517 RepID=UPI002D77415E|nr:uncharacterized protein LOC133867466 [Alnus glutinosa]
MVKSLMDPTSIEDLCHGCPIEFESCFHYCRSLHFDSEPDYGYLKRMFRHLFSREALGRSSVYPLSSRIARPSISVGRFPEEKNVAKVSEVALGAKCQINQVPLVLKPANLSRREKLSRETLPDSRSQGHIFRQKGLETMSIFLSA